MTIFNRIIFGCFVLVMLPFGAQAAQTAWVSGDNVQGKLISMIDAVGTEETIAGLLHLRLNEGWHTYWRTPGDSGLPPKFDWGKSTNVKEIEISYPAPKRFDEMGLQVFGYADEVMFPLTITPEIPGKAVDLSLKIEMLVCHEICVPEFINLALNIPDGAAVNSKSAAIQDFAARKIPAQNNAGLKIESAVAGPQALVVNAYAKRGFDQADLFVEADGLVITAIPEIVPDTTDPRQAMIKIGLPFGESDMQKALAGKNVRITLSDGHEAVEQVVPF